MKMIRDDWETWTYMLIAVVVVIWVIALFGCAGPEPESPITMYRVMYGFEPERYRVVYDQNQQLGK